MTMNGEMLIALERHERLRDAHAIVIQAIKYPQTVSPASVAKAKALIDAHVVLAGQMLKPNREPDQS